MKKKLLLLIIFVVSIFFSTNIYAYDKYDGDYTIEYLIKNYNVVTLGTKDRYNYSLVDNTEKTKGSVTNIFDIGGPVLIRGNYTGDINLKYNNEYAQKTNCISSYIKGKIGSKINAGSKELAEISNIYVGSSNKVTKVGDTYKVNNDTYNDPYEVKVSDDYIDFDKLYAAIVNEQKEISEGTRLTLSQFIYSSDKQRLKSLLNRIDLSSIMGTLHYSSEVGHIIDPITTPGNYTISRLDTVKDIKIVNYDPNSLYVITVEDEYIYSMPILYLSQTEDIYISAYVKLSNEVYKGRTKTDDLYSGNIIFNFPNARYIHTNYSHIGHIIAPKADVELTETSYPGCIIANSIASKPNTYTAIQFYPYKLENNLSNKKISTKVSEKKEIDVFDLYDGNYSLDELLKNYSVVTLGQNEYTSSSSLKNLTNKKGTVDMFHIVGPFLVSGNMGTSSRTLRLDNRYKDFNAHSYVRGDFNSIATAYYSYFSEYKNRSSIEMRSSSFYLSGIFFNGLGPNFFVGTSNKIHDAGGAHDLIYQYAQIGDTNVYLSTNYSTHEKKDYSYYNYAPAIINDGVKYLDRRDIFNSDNYINFETLYNSIIEQQKKISKGTTIDGNNYNDFDADIVDVEVGKNYNISNISNIKRLRFTNFEQNKDKLTIITINDSGTVTLPWLLSKTSQGDDIEIHTNDWYGTIINYPYRTLYSEMYHGNIVWNIPNATKVTNYDSNEFIGHIIAPKADVELKATTAGAIIANSVYGPGNQEAHFYPLTVGSVGTGIEKEVVTLGDEVEKIKISVNKTWNDNNDKLRPNKITVRLLANGKEVKSATITEKDKWEYVFEVDRVDEYGKKINYTVTEDAIKNYFAKTEPIITYACLEGCPGTVEGYTITNTYEEESENPTTGDNVTKYIIISVVSIIAILILVIGILVYRKKKNN